MVEIYHVTKGIRNWGHLRGRRNVKDNGKKTENSDRSNSESHGFDFCLFDENVFQYRAHFRSIWPGNLCAVSGRNL